MKIFLKSIIVMLVLSYPRKTFCINILKHFIFVNEHFPLKEKVEKLESGMYACIYLDDFMDEKEYAKRLLDYCEKNHYEIIGDYICEVLIELTFFNQNNRSMYLRLQVPIAFKKTLDPHQ